MPLVNFPVLGCGPVNDAAEGRRGRLAHATGAWPWLVCLLVLATAPATPLQAGEWSSNLQGGGKVTVDPRTNRITVQRRGVESQLWDGVHRLEDGSSITVRSGQVVPNKEILRARRQPDMPEPTEGSDAEVWIGAPIVGYSPCEKLVQRVCGEGRKCGGKDGCAAAEQLLQMEQQQRAAEATPNRMTYSSGQCQEADRDRQFFASCGAQPAPWAAGEATAPYAPPSTCQLLVEKVCGSQAACSGDTACDAAQQLLHLAQDEPPGTGATDHQCREALGDQAFFKRCDR